MILTESSIKIWWDNENLRFHKNLYGILRKGTSTNLVHSPENDEYYQDFSRALHQQLTMPIYTKNQHAGTKERSLSEQGENRWSVI